jgi:hypothetical protein
MVRNREKCRADVNTVMNFRVSKSARNFLTGSRNLSLSGRAVLCAVQLSEIKSVACYSKWCR